MTGRWQEGLLRQRIWLIPAVIAGLATVVVLLALGAYRATDGPAVLPREQTAVPTAVASTPARSQSTFERPPITLQPSGLGVVGFGQRGREAILILTDRLGTPDEHRPERCTPGQGPASHWFRWADLSIRIVSNRFVAYIEGVHFPPGSPPWGFATDQGVAPGDPTSTLEDTYGAGFDLGRQLSEPGRVPFRMFTVRETSPEGELSGVAEGHEPDSTVASLFAGDFC